MEMHTIDSLRRIHGIRARNTPKFRPFYKMSFAEYHRMAARERGKLYIKSFSAGWKAAARFVRVFIIAPAKRENDIRRAERILMKMSSHELNDLGIAHGDIPHVVRHGKPDAR